MPLPTSLFAELKKASPDNRTINLVFHGHSVPAGYHKTPEVKPFESYPLMSLQRIKPRFPNAVINVITTAIGGEHCILGANRFERDVLPFKPDVVFIDYALNDRKLPLREVEEHWHKMVQLGTNAGVAVVLMTPTGDSDANYRDPNDPLVLRADLIRRLAIATNVTLCDVFVRWTRAIRNGTDESTLLSRSNHPNAAGHAIAADAIAALFVED